MPPRRRIVSGQMRPGDPFPSVRALSEALRSIPIPRTKWSLIYLPKDCSKLPGTGTVVAHPPASTAAERSSAGKRAGTIGSRRQKPRSRD